MKNLDLIAFNQRSQYACKNADNDHHLIINYVANLFGLACCPAVLATPVSGYSSWAANVLSVSAACLVDLAGATRKMAKIEMVNIHGNRLPRWRADGSGGSDTVALGKNLARLELVKVSDTGWL